MSQTWNFYAGPATLPAPALERAKAEIPNWENTGMSVMETSHRSPEYDVVHYGAMKLLSELLGSRRRPPGVCSSRVALRLSSPCCR